jgi:plasmid segregation protein ParM
MVLDDNGQETGRDLSEERVGVLDVGFRTSDYFTLHAYEVIPTQCITRNTGMADLLLDVSRELNQRWGVQIDPHELDAPVLRGFIKLAGRRVDITDLVGGIAERHAGAILAHARMIWGEGAQLLDRLLLTGGGAVTLKAIRSMAPHAELVGNPRMANAIGYYRYAVHLFTSRK